MSVLIDPSVLAVVIGAIAAIAGVVAAVIIDRKRNRKILSYAVFVTEPVSIEDTIADSI